MLEGPGREPIPPALEVRDALQQRQSGGGIVGQVLKQLPMQASSATAAREWFMSAA